MVRFSYLISFRNNGQARLENLLYIIRQLCADNSLDVVLVEQDKRPRIRKVDLPETCRYYYVENAGPFNKSWGLNIAASHAHNAFLVFADADMLLSDNTLIQMQDLFRNGADSINPYTDLIDLSKEESNVLMSEDSQLTINRSEKDLSRQMIGEVLPFCGGVFAITATLYEQVGGFDERFEGWGGEDNAMSIRLEHFAKDRRVLDGNTAYHLWHERSEETKGNQASIIPNLALLSFYYESYHSVAEQIAEHDLNNNAKLDKYLPSKGQTKNAQPTPLISCLCVTRHRVNLLKRAIACFRAQSYENRELIIVCEDDDAETASFIKQLTDNNIRCFVIPSHPKLTLGELRNKSIQYARGKYVCQWDDDDWYHARRIEIQLEIARKNNKAASILPRWLIYSLAGNKADSDKDSKAYSANIRLWEGSLLCKKSYLIGANKYGELATGEDTVAIKGLFLEDELAIEDHPDLYVYIHSGQNTWDDQHFQRILKASQELSAKDTQKLANRIRMN